MVVDKLQKLLNEDKNPCRFCGRTFDVKEDEIGSVCGVCQAKLDRGMSLTIKHPKSIHLSAYKIKKEQMNDKINVNSPAVTEPIMTR